MGMENLNYIGKEKGNNEKIQEKGKRNKRHENGESYLHGKRKRE